MDQLGPTDSQLLIYFERYITSRNFPGRFYLFNFGKNFICMKILSVLAFVTGLFFATACSNDNGKRNLMPEIAGCDSAVVMYYQTPGNPRFFSMTKLYDKASFAAIEKAVNGKTISGKDSCVTEGKIYFYGKAGAVYPVYFSREKDCMTLSFIKTGEKYYTRMSDGVNKELNKWKKSAKELRTAD
jgi:basic membrane lipoprotein Med (substrate-binding protein (PBP1-ABC) superfamily)